MKQATTKISHAKFWVLLKQMENYNEEYKEEIKASWVSSYSGGKTTSLSGLYNMSKTQYRKMLKDMEGIPNMEQRDRANRQRRKLLALIYSFCKHKGYTCTKQQALQIACRTCGVRSLNNASEQKLIAAIRRFDNDVIDMAVDELVKSCMINKQ